MAIIKNSRGDTVEVPNGETCIDQLEDIEVPFGCRAGSCHTCLVIIVSGMENIEEKTEEEDTLEENERLMCQCKFKDGEIEIRE